MHEGGEFDTDLAELFPAVPMHSQKLATIDRQIRKLRDGMPEEGEIDELEKSAQLLLKERKKAQEEHSKLVNWAENHLESEKEYQERVGQRPLKRTVLKPLLAKEPENNEQ